MKPLVPAVLALSFAVSVAASAAFAAAPSKSALEVTDGWSRPAAAGTNGVGYLTILNHGARPQTLVAVEAPIAQKVEMHSMSMQGGVMRMGPVASVVVPAGGKAAFEPGGYHLMLVGLKKPLNLGDQISATLRFADGEKVAARLSVAVMAPPL
jgi:copper(I)-binding protein